MHAQFGGFFHQPVHALVGGHAGDQVHDGWRLALDRMVFPHPDLNLLSSHVLYLGVIFATATVEQCQRIAWLQAQHLHMPCSTWGQRHEVCALQGQVTVQAGHGHGLLGVRAQPRPITSVVSGAMPSTSSIRRKRGMSSRYRLAVERM